MFILVLILIAAIAGVVASICGVLIGCAQAKSAARNLKHAMKEKRKAAEREVQGMFRNIKHI